MKRFLRYFSRRKHLGWNERVFLPVIHVESGNEFDSGYEGVRVAYESGADGAFLIAHGGTSHDELTRAVNRVQEALLAEDIDFPVGANYLDLMWKPELPIKEAMRFGKIPMIWTDNPRGRQEVEAARDEFSWDGLYFGAVAFKYQISVPIDELPKVARDARWMDVLTTSGIGTGQEIDLNKAKVFSDAVPGSVLGVASGVSSENIEQLLPYFNAFLVSTSISLDFHRLDPGKTKKLADQVSSWSA